MPIWRSTFANRLGAKVLSGKGRKRKARLRNENACEASGQEAKRLDGLLLLSFAHTDKWISTKRHGPPFKHKDGTCCQANGLESHVWNRITRTSCEQLAYGLVNMDSKLNMDPSVSLSRPTVWNITVGRGGVLRIETYADTLAQVMEVSGKPVSIRSIHKDT